MDGWTCNLEPVGHYDAPGGFRTQRYVDEAGNECAYYDTAAISPLSAVNIPGLRDTGVMVLDMSDPSNPRRTDLLTELPMQTPHESLNVHRKRGLLAATMGNLATYPGLLSLYDVSKDCREPELLSTRLVSHFGHESGWAPDGKTLWIGGVAGLAAIDVTNPRAPKTLWDGALFAHGLSVSRDGNRLYVADSSTAT